MDARKQKHRVTHWFGRLFVVFSCVASWGALAAVTQANNCSWQYNIRYYGYALGMTRSNTFSTPAEACSDVIGFVNSYTNVVATLTSCPSEQGSLSSPLAMGKFASSPPWPDPNATTFAILKVGTYAYICANTLTITLSGGSEVEPSNGSTLNTLPFIASVKDQNTGQPPTIPVTVKISLKVDDLKSGGHAHGTSDRPRGGIANVQTCPSDDTCWSWESPANNGVVVFNFNPTETSGKYIVSATCKGCSNTETAKVNVKVKEADAAGWDQLTASPAYELVGGEAGKEHHDNHYLTATSRKNLIKLVKAYNFEYPTGPVLYLNDASLVWGGKFDISGKWTGAHANHRRGVVIDIRANQLSTAIPLLRFAEFKKIATNNGAFADLHCAFPSRFSWACWADTGPNRHFHVRLLGKGIDR